MKEINAMWPLAFAENDTVRKASFVVLSMFLINVLMGSRVSAQGISPTVTPEQLAAAIARTMIATTPNIPANSPIAEHFSSHGNVVEVHIDINDARIFSDMMAKRDDFQLSSTRYNCNPERRGYLKRGVVFHNVTSGPGSAGSFQFTIDEKACASLVDPVAASTATLTKMAEGVARQLTASSPAESPTRGFRTEKPIVHDELVQVVNIIIAPGFAQYLQVRGFEVRGQTQGRFCANFGDVIRQGVRVQVIYKFENSAPVLEFSVDKSVC